VAWVAAKRGHHVHVYEKQAALGGQLLPGSRPSHKAELKSLIQFQKKQAEIFGVTCHLNHAVDEEDIMSENPDVIVLATGSLPVLPTVDGIEKDIVLTYEDVLNGDRPTYTKAAVIGGGPTGLELALYLAEYGCSSTVVEMLPKIGHGLEAMTRKILLEKLNTCDVQFMTETRLTRIEDNGATVTDKYGMELFVEAERVIIAIGMRPDQKLYEKIKSSEFEIHRIGDCLEPRSAKAAIFESAVLGRKI
jgi:NADPH-dependent 2,4-dienoyl-CoA reductase/sulfur reductase-like enzyme